MKFWMLALGIFLMGCQGSPGGSSPVATESPAPGAAPVVEDQSWFTYFAPDGSFSLQFPKAPEESGGPQQKMLVHGLDKKGSNLSLILMPIPANFKEESVVSNPGAFFANQNLKLVKSQKASWSGHEGLQLELESQGNRLWIHMIFARPWLYQLVALQSAQSEQDHAAERNQFFGSFQFTQKK